MIGRYFLLKQRRGCRRSRRLVLHSPVRFGLVGEQWESRAGANHIIGQGQDDPFGVAVVDDLVAGTVPQDAADLRSPQVFHRVEWISQRLGMIVL